MRLVCYELLKLQAQEAVKDKLTQVKLTHKKNFDSHTSKDLPVLQKGEVV